MSSGPGSGQRMHGSRHHPLSQHGGYSLSGVGGVPHFKSLGSHDAIKNAKFAAAQIRAWDAQINAAFKDINTAMTGGFGSGVKAASDGTLPIASSTGLMVGTVWGRNVVTGADSVLTQADFTQISTPQIGSALAKTALGTAGMLGPAGSGAEMAVTPPVTVTPIQVTVTVNSTLDGAPFDSKIASVVNTTLGKLADAVGAQRG